MAYSVSLKSTISVIVAKCVVANKNESDYIEICRRSQSAFKTLTPPVGNGFNVAPLACTCKVASDIDQVPFVYTYTYTHFTECVHCENARVMQATYVCMRAHTCEINTCVSSMSYLHSDICRDTVTNIITSSIDGHS